MTFWVLTFEYYDNSAFRVCGITDSWSTADAWIKASNGEHKVYTVELNQISEWDKGIEPWKPVSKIRQP